jgi:hypothetical protein
LAFVITFEECDAACADWDYVSDLLLDNEKVSGITRWEFEPSVAVINGTPVEVHMVAGAVHELNQVLSDTGFRLRYTEAERAEIQVIFGSREELNDLNPAY